MKPIEIPLTAKNQEFDIQLGNKVYHLRIVFREYCGWILDVMTQSKEDILTGIPLLHGVNIFEQYSYLGLSGSLTFHCENPENELEQSELGKGNKLYFKDY